MLARLLKLALTLALLGAAAPAWAAYKFVHPSGTATWANATDSSSSTTCASMDTANARAVAGDIVRMVAGSYTTKVPNPANNGTGYTALIQYLGQSDSTAVTFSSNVTLTRKAFIKIKGFRLTGSADAVMRGTSNCIMESIELTNGYVSMVRDAQDNSSGVDSCRMSFIHMPSTDVGEGPFFVINDDGAAEQVADSTVARGVARWDTLSYYTGTMTDFNGSQAFTQLKATRFLLLDNLKLTMHSGSGGSTSGRLGWWYSTHWATVRDCKFTYVHDVANNDGGFKWREGCYDNTWLRDTLIQQRGAAALGTDMTLLYYFGTEGGGSYAGRNRWNHCYFKQDTSMFDISIAQNVTGGFGWGANEYQMCSDSIAYCTFVTYGGLFSGTSSGDNTVESGCGQDLVLRHNTIITFRRTAVQQSDHVCRPYYSIGQSANLLAFNGSEDANNGVVFKNNLIIAPRLQDQNYSAGYSCAAATMDSSYLMAISTEAANDFVDADSNVYCAPLLSAGNGGQIFSGGAGDCGAGNCTEWTLAEWKTASGDEAASREVSSYDSLGFLNPSWTSFDSRISATSAAVFSDGNFAGAHPPEALQGGATPSVSFTSATDTCRRVYTDSSYAIKWTTPGYTPDNIRIYVGKREYYYAWKLVATGEADDSTYSYTIPDSMWSDSLKFRIVAYTDTDSATDETLCAWYACLKTPHTSGGTPTTDSLTYSIPDNNSDCNAGSAGNSVDNAESAVYAEPPDGTNTYGVGFFRFERIDIPSGATITHARLHLTGEVAGQQGTFTAACKAESSATPALYNVTNPFGRNYNSTYVTYELVDNTITNNVIVTSLVQDLIDNFPTAYDSSATAAMSFGIAGNNWTPVSAYTDTPVEYFLCQRNGNADEATFTVVYETGGLETTYVDSCGSLPTQLNDPPDVSAVGTADASPVTHGTASNITWTATDDNAVSYVNIRLSSNSGSTYTLLAANEPNDGAYLYTWPDLGTTFRVKVTAYDAQGAADSLASVSDFSVTDQTPPTINIVTPQPGDSLLAGSDTTITWTWSDDAGATAMAIWYSVDSGLNWLNLFNGADPDLVNGTTPWSVPDSVTTDARIRIWMRDAAGNQASDSIMGVIIYEESGDVTPPVVSLTVPDGGQSWNEGQGRTITWTATDSVGVTAIGLWYSTNSGSNWTSIAQGETNDGAYLWTVPNVERESGNMRIRVWATDAAGNDASDSSSTSFTVLDTLRPNKVRNLWASRVEWTAVKLQWTGVANCTTTVLKYDTTPLTESGANNFRTHGTSVSTGTPSGAGVLDSATVTGLSPGTRYYFALRHIDNDGVTPETSLVSIGEVRTTRPAVSKGLGATSTRSYPLLGWRAVPWWESDVTAVWPRSEAGWPVYPDSAGAQDLDALRDTAASAIYGYQMARGTVGYGTARVASVGASYRPHGWGVPDSAFKARVPSLISVAGTIGFAFGNYKQHGGSTDTTGWAPDDPWQWGEMVNWARRTQDTTMSRRWGNHMYPERLFLWSKKQNAGYVPLMGDTCAWGSWYGDDDGTCFGMGQNAVYRFNLLSRDTTTGDWDVMEHLADWIAYRSLRHTQYRGDTTKYLRDGFWTDYGATNVDTRFIAAGDSVDVSRSGLDGVVPYYNNAAVSGDFVERWAEMAKEFYARLAAYRDTYSPNYKMHQGNIGSADVLVTSDWDVSDALELDYTGTKGTGGRMGLLSNIYGRRFAETPQIEPSFSTVSFSRPSSSTSIVMFPWAIIDSCAPCQTGNYGQTAARGALGLAYGAFYDDFVPTFEFKSETVGSMTDAGAPDSCSVVANVYLSPFYWDEPYVDVASGDAVGWGAFGTGTGKGWLGRPVDDRFKWASTALADTNLLTVGTSSIDGSFCTLQGWRPTGGGAWPTSNSLGIVDTMRVDNGRHPRGTHGTSDTIVRVRRAAIDHTNYYDIGFRVNNGYGVALDPSVHHTVRWWCKADTPTYVIPVLRNQVTGNASGQGTNAMVWVDTTWRQYEMHMGRKETGASAAVDTGVQVAFYLGDTLGTVYFDDVELYNKPAGVMYRRFDNGVVFINPDSGRVAGDSAGVTAWRSRGGQVVNYATVFGDTATYDYRLIDGVNPNRKSLNNGRIFGYAALALDTIPDGQAKFVIRAPNNYWNTFLAGKRAGKGRIDRLMRGRGR